MINNQTGDQTHPGDSLIESSASSNGLPDHFKAIGGYFELELNKGLEYHSDAIPLNTGRNAFEYVLRGREYKKVYLPYYTCEAMLRPITKLGIEHEFYHIDKNFEPLFDFTKIQEDEGFVYTNYYGLKDHCVETLARTCRNLIVDNAQSFFSKPVSGADVFYSPHKFFGLPDGAYLYTTVPLQEELEQDHSDQRFEHLLVRTEYQPEDGYLSFLRNCRCLDGLPIRRMSNLTRRLLMNINYPQVSNIRRTNFLSLHADLGFINELKLELMDNQVPMVYPFYTHLQGTRKRLIENRIFVAQYWPNLLQWTHQNDLEHDYANNLIPLPIDQRYSQQDMEQIVAVVQDILIKNNGC